LKLFIIEFELVIDSGSVDGGDDGAIGRDSEYSFGSSRFHGIPCSLSLVSVISINVDVTLKEH
jgi:hypothetical protein